MVKSMTGFGKGEAALRIRKYGRDPPNSKQLDSVSLPAVYRQSEYEIRKPDRLHDPAGKVDVRHGRVAGCRNVGAHHREVFREYLRQMMNDTLPRHRRRPHAILPVIMRLPDVVAPRPRPSPKVSTPRCSPP